MTAMMTTKTSMKHNKKRNSAFLYEVLVRCLTAASLKGDDSKKKVIVSLLREHFSKSTLLWKELSCYRMVFEAKVLKESVVSRMLEEAKREYDKISTKDLFVEQSRLIRAVNTKLGSDVFSVYVPKYKELATAYQIFNRKVPITEQILLENRLISALCEDKKKEEAGVDVDALTFKILVEKFNKTYDTSILKEQRQALSYYIYSGIDGGIELRAFLNEEISRLREVISSNKEINEDAAMKESSTKILEFLGSFKTKKDYSEEDLEKLFEVQEIVREAETSNSEKVSRSVAKDVGEGLGMSWSEYNLDEFYKGMNTELEHGKKDPQTNITSDNLEETGKIALAHLKEKPDYYTLLKKVEGKKEQN